MHYMIHMAGRPKDVSDRRILREIVFITGPATATELADAVGMNRSGMNKRLDDLVERGLVREKKVGASAVVYWLSDDGKGRLRDG